TLNINGAVSGAWDNTTSDVRALLQAASNTTDRIASYWTSYTRFTIGLNLTDGQAHRLALYALDWDNYGGGRNERIDVLDTASGAVLDSRSVSGFSGGEYLIWDVRGDVTV